MIKIQERTLETLKELQQNGLGILNINILGDLPGLNREAASDLAIGKTLARPPLACLRI